MICEGFAEELVVLLVRGGGVWTVDGCIHGHEPTSVDMKEAKDTSCAHRLVVGSLLIGGARV